MKKVKKKINTQAIAGTSAGSVTWVDNPPKKRGGGLNFLKNAGATLINTTTSSIGGVLGNPELIPEVGLVGGQTAQKNWNKFSNVTEGIAGVTGGLATKIGLAAIGVPPQVTGAIQQGVGAATENMTIDEEALSKDGSVMRKGGEVDRTRLLLDNGKSVPSKYKVTKSKGLKGIRDKSSPLIYKDGGSVPEYEAEGGEVIEHPQEQPVTIGQGGLQSLSSDTSKIQGPQHEQGGVKMKGGERIYSDKLKVHTGKTFAEEAEELGKRKAKFEKLLKEGDDLSRASAQLMLSRLNKQMDTLFAQQEAMKESDLGFYARYGGYYENGGLVKGAKYEDLGEVGMTEPQFIKRMGGIVKNYKDELPKYQFGGGGKDRPLTDDEVDRRLVEGQQLYDNYNNAQAPIQLFEPINYSDPQGLLSTRKSPLPEQMPFKQRGLQTLSNLNRNFQYPNVMNPNAEFNSIRTFIPNASGNTSGGYDPNFYNPDGTVKSVIGESTLNPDGSSTIKNGRPTLYNTPAKSRSGVPGFDPETEYHMTLEEYEALNQQQPQIGTKGISGLAGRGFDFESDSADLGTEIPTSKGAKLGSLLEGAATYAPTIYNLAQGIFGKKDYYKRTPNHQVKQALQEIDKSKEYDISERLASNQRGESSLRKMVKESTTHAGQFLQTASAINAQRRNADAQAYDEKNRFMSNANARAAQMRNAIGEQERAEDRQVQINRMQTDAKKRDFLAQGLTGLSGITQTNKLMRNQASRDEELLDLMETTAPTFNKYYLKALRKKYAR